MFGLFALSGKATSFISPWLVGLLTGTFRSQRIGMSSVFIFLFMGAVLLIGVSEIKHE
jgi:UMF1 family MFS transporter